MLNSPLDERPVCSANRKNVLIVRADNHAGNVLAVTSVTHRCTNLRVRPIKHIHKAEIVAGDNIVATWTTRHIVDVSIVLAWRLQTLAIFAILHRV